MSATLSPPHPDQHAGSAALPGLSTDTHDVLHAAATVIASRPAGGPDPATVVGDRTKADGVLTLLVQVPALRQATRVVLGDRAVTLDGSVAGLVGDDPDRAAAAAATVRSALDAGRRAARAARRAERSARRPSATERAQDRSRRDLEEAREARDRAHARHSAAEAELARTRVELAEAREALTETRAQLAAAQARAAQGPSRANLASRLADLLFPTARSSQLLDPTAHPGSPAPVNPGHAPHTAPATALPEPVLTRLARTAGLPLQEAQRAGEWLPRLLHLIASPPREHLTVTDQHISVDVLGAADEVAGSAVLVSGGGTRILIDAGTRPGPHARGPHRIEQALAAKLDAVVVTHAHNDHAGWVPAVVAAQPDVPVLCTAETAALMETMLADSAKVIARRASDSDNGAPAAYGPAEVAAALAATAPLPFGQVRRVGALDLELFPAGHIVGAAGVVLGAGEHRVVISGDVSGPGQLTVGGWALPERARRAGLLVMESTYGAQDVAPRARSAGDFVKAVARVVERGGRVLVPAFALGRAQEIALLLGEHLPQVPVLIDGLARDVTDTYEGLPGPTGAPLRVYGPKVVPVPRGGTHHAIAKLRSGVVIATSGMLHAGPAVSWARSILPDPDSAVFLVGYQDTQAPGRQLLQVAQDGAGTFALPGAPGQPPTQVGVHATVEVHGLGAHASANELVTLAAEAAAEKVMLVHGDRSAQQALTARLRGRRQGMASSLSVHRLG